MTANVRSLGWLGTGRMGAALAGRLIEAGERVTVWNRTSAKTAPLVSGGRGPSSGSAIWVRATSCS